MSSLNLLHIESFEKQRTNPKVLWKILLFIFTSILVALIAPQITDIISPIKEKGLSQSKIDEVKPILSLITSMSLFLGSAFVFLIYFVLILIITKITKLKVAAKSIFSSTLLMLIITSIITLVAMSIQWLFGFQLPNINIASLNIFSPGQPQLSAISLQNIVTAWLFGVILYSTCRMSKKWSAILAILHFMIYFSFSFLS
ncbi:hypothetical protein [Staphylococcus ratti]|uniref:Yip1 domain-containing protein n=1 Tax=Staphylococcus ratti TaxID=2892440 RepID=A0ABY3PDH5_9STAP|nr:hypothetical protein [Staphylococcus ratti]UEX90363.1 hypothetical protein LN051_01445 [Staphylococcus ratti]